ncbi:MAG: YlmH/Sll1252 family protein [Bacillota bacterium]|nr:YlmH/Sll1252 family protein [Bacillota bacterium]
MSSGSPLSDEEKRWQQQFIRKLDELQGNKTYHTNFLDPRQLELAEAALHKESDLAYTVFGGYPEAERNVLAVFPSRFKNSLPPVKIIKVSWHAGDGALNHRDLLGAVLALGFKRDQVGDILVFEDSWAAVMVLESKAEFICSNLIQVGKFTVSCNLIEADQLPFSHDKGKEIKGTVASLRVDSVISLGFGISRARVVLLVKGGLVRVNWRQIDSPSYQLKAGDQVSLKGRGRLLLEEDEGETRKGRIRVRLKKYS